MNNQVDLKKAQKIDPLKKQPLEGVKSEELSPMDPPEAYKPPATVEQVPYEKMPMFLKKLIDEHKEFKNRIDSFEEAILAVVDEGITKQTNQAVRDFFYYFDNDFRDHNQREEKKLFVLLHEKFLETGEYSQGSESSPVTVLEEDHFKATQQAAVIFNFFSLAFRLPDRNSSLIVFDTALEKSKELIELLRLHIFREENIVFPLACKLVSKNQFTCMENCNCSHK